MMHVHTHQHCDHKLQFCNCCDVVFCNKCYKEWKNTTYYSYPTWTMGGNVPLTGDCGNGTVYTSGTGVSGAASAHTHTTGFMQTELNQPLYKPESYNPDDQPLQ